MIYQLSKWSKQHRSSRENTFFSLARSLPMFILHSLLSPVLQAYSLQSEAVAQYLLIRMLWEFSQNVRNIPQSFTYICSWSGLYPIKVKLRASFQEGGVREGGEQEHNKLYEVLKEPIRKVSSFCGSISRPLCKLQLHGLVELPYNMVVSKQCRWFCHS